MQKITLNFIIYILSYSYIKWDKCICCQKRYIRNNNFYLYSIRQIKLYENPNKYVY
jgi:hypothetical protein